MGNVARSLDDLAAPDAFGHYFVKRLVSEWLGLRLHSLISCSTVQEHQLLFALDQ